MNVKRHLTRERDAFSPSRVRRLRRWLIAVPAALMVLVVLVWSIPVIVASTSLRQTIVSAALADFEGTVRVGSASLGWLSPLRARDIEARDLQGQPLGQAAELQSDKSLLGLLADTSRPGTFRVRDPQVRLVLRPDGSNWEDALVKLLSGPSQGRPVRALTIQVDGGTLQVEDTAHNGRFRLERLNLALQMDEASPLPIKVRAAADVTADGERPGQVAVDVAWKPGETDATYLGEGQMVLRGESLSLAAVSSAAQRFFGDVRARGAANCDALWQWREGGNRHRLQVDRLETGSVALQAPAWFGSDTLRSDTLRGNAQLEASGDTWKVERLTVDTDFAQLAAQGVLQANDIASVTDWARFVGQVPAVDLKVDGRVDLARLAQMLPSTLNLRASTAIKSGQVTLSLVNQATKPPRLNARIEASDLAAVENGREFVWQKPILLTANLRRSDTGPVIDELTCRSSFLDVSASGTLDRGTAKIRGDLRQLATDVGRFIDLADYQMSGRLDGDFRWQQTAGEQIAADGQLELAEFELSSSGQLPWREKQLTVKLAAAAELAGSQIQRIASAKVHLQSGTDELTSDLLQPVNAADDAVAWPLGLKLRGNLATWMPRLRPFVPVGDRRMAGLVNLDATTRVSTQRIDAEAVKLQIDQFQSREWDLAIDEPVVRLDGKGTWDTRQGRITVEDVAMTSSAVAFRAQRVVVQLPDSGPALSGQLSYRADLGRVAQWLHASEQPAGAQLTGRATGTLQATHEAGVTQVNLTADAEDVVFATRKTPAGPTNIVLATASNPWVEAWREPSIKLTARQRFDRARDALEIQELTASGNAIRLVASGRIEQFSGARLAQLSGEADYDWADVSAKLSPYLGTSVKIIGRDKGRFALSGPLRESAVSSGPSAAVVAPTALTGSARLGWESASLYGLLAGKGELRASLADGVLQFAPLQIPLSEGQFRAVSRIPLNSPPTRLGIDRGQLLDHVRLSPELCRTWLKYVAPLLADATSAEGRFSVLLDGASVPLADADQSNVHGQLTIHAAQIGPGPLAQPLLGLAQQVKSVARGQALSASPTGFSEWLVIPEQTVRVDVENGRVRHQGLTMSSGDVTIRTSGSVGFDESLAIMAEIPIRDEWVTDKKYLASLRGTVIQIPVQGTLGRPHLDNRMLSELSARLVGGAARGILQDEVTRGLQRLFGPTSRGSATAPPGGAP